MLSGFYKNNESDKILWATDLDEVGADYFTFDGKKIYNLFADYPHNLTPEEKEIFDAENPYWKEFFAWRCEPGFKMPDDDDDEELDAMDEADSDEIEELRRKYPGLNQCKGCKFIEDGDTFCHVYTVYTKDAFGTPGIPAGICIKNEPCPYRTTDEG